MRFSSTWDGEDTDEEDAFGMVREAMAGVLSCCWRVRGNIVGAVSLRIWEGVLHSSKAVGAESVP